MNNKLLPIIFLSFFLTLPAFAFEDVIITNNSKLTEIKLENNEIIDVFPLITVMNDKNTLIVHPLKEGNTRFTVLKNNKNIALFSVKVEAGSTTVNAPEGFDVFPVDTPPIGKFDFELDKPPVWNKY